MESARQGGGAMTPNRAEVLVLADLKPETIMQDLASRFTCHLGFDEAKRNDMIARHGRSVRGLVTTGTRGADAALIASLPALEIIAVFGVGTDAVALGAVRSRGVHVTNTPDVLTDDVADFAIGLYLSGLRLITRGDRAVRAGLWSAPLETDLPLSAQRRKVGIVGMGRIGQAIAHRLSVFDAEIAYAKSSPVADVPFRHFTDLTAMAEACEVLFVAVPGGAATKNLIGASVLEALGPQGLLINIARGSVVDEPALCEALTTGKLGAAALDVFADEPRVPPDLVALPNTILTPHIGSFTYEARREMGRLVVQNLTAHFSGANLVTPVGSRQ